MNILGIQWMDKVREKIGFAWAYHQKAKQQHYKTGLGVEPSGQKKSEGGGIKNNRGRDLEADITQTGLSWQQLERITQDRRRRRDVVNGTWSRRSQEPNYVIHFNEYEKHSSDPNPKSRIAALCHGSRERWQH